MTTNQKTVTAAQVNMLRRILAVGGERLPDGASIASYWWLHDLGLVEITSAGHVFVNAAGCRILAAAR